MSYKSSSSGTELETWFFVGEMADRIPSDLLLPGDLVPFAIRLKGLQGGWRDLIIYLLNRYTRQILEIADRTENLRFRYQPSGRCLTRISYLPNRDALVRLRMLSYAARISMCALVVLMLTWESEREEKSESNTLGVPMTFRSGWAVAGKILTVSAKISLRTDHPPPRNC